MGAATPRHHKEKIQWKQDSSPHQLLCWVDPENLEIEMGDQLQWDETGVRMPLRVVPKLISALQRCLDAQRK